MIYSEKFREEKIKTDTENPMLKKYLSQVLDFFKQQKNQKSASFSEYEQLIEDFAKINISNEKLGSDIRGFQNEINNDSISGLEPSDFNNFWDDFKDISSMLGVIIRHQIIVLTSHKLFVNDKIEIYSLSNLFQLLNYTVPNQKNDESDFSCNLIRDHKFLELKYYLDAILQNATQSIVNESEMIEFMRNMKLIDFKEPTILHQDDKKEIRKIIEKLGHFQKNIPSKLCFSRIHLDQIRLLAKKFDCESTGVLGFFKDEIIIWIDNFEKILKEYEEQFLAIFKTTKSRIKALKKRLNGNLDNYDNQEIAQYLHGCLYFGLSDLKNSIIKYFISNDKCRMNNLIISLFEENSFLVSEKALDLNWPLINKLKSVYRELSLTIDKNEPLFINISELELFSFLLHFQKQGNQSGIFELSDFFDGDPILSSFQNFNLIFNQIEKNIKKVKENLPMDEVKYNWHKTFIISNTKESKEVLNKINQLESLNGDFKEVFLDRISEDSHGQSIFNYQLIERILRRNNLFKAVKITAPLFLVKAITNESEDITQEIIGNINELILKRVKEIIDYF